MFYTREIFSTYIMNLRRKDAWVVLFHGSLKWKLLQPICQLPCEWFRICLDTIFQNICTKEKQVEKKKSTKILHVLKLVNVW